MKTMTEGEFFERTKSAYMSFIHLEYNVSESLASIYDCEPSISNDLIRKLVLGESWRERLLGLVLASKRGYPHFYNDMLASLHDVRGISTVPMSAVLSIAVKEMGCKYTADMTSTLDPTAMDGEIGFALDHLHHAIGLGPKPLQLRGPNYGQPFAIHRAFYLDLSIIEGV
jgi:hypothetical protein